MTELLLSLIPTVVTVAVAFGTRKVWLALLLGVFSGAAAFSGFGIGTFSRFGKYLLGSFGDAERLKITFFVMMIAGMLAVISETGANLKFGRSVGHILPGKRSARFAAVGLSSLLFFDDYANVLIAGASMRPVTDSHGVSPAKLAYFIDVIAGLASVMLISTWAAFEVSLIGGALKGAGLEMGPVSVFLRAVPFHIFTIFNIFLVLLVAFNGRWFSRKDCSEAASSEKRDDDGVISRRRDMVIPVAVLLAVSLGGILITGIKGAGPGCTLVDILGNASSIDSLIAGVVAAVTVMAVLMRKDGILPLGRMAGVFGKGLRSMIPTGAVIILAKGLEFCAKDLGTGYNLSGLFGESLPLKFVPAFVFIIAAAITVASGFSWSSMALVMPIAVQMTAAEPGIVLWAVSATISGAICGAQMIPYSDKTVMTAAACGISSICHAGTQFRQVAAAAIVAFAGYMLLGCGAALGVVLAAGMAVLAAVHFFAGR